MTKLKSGKSKNNSPSHERYASEKRWLKNKARKIAKYNREVEEQRKKKKDKLENRVARIEKEMFPKTGKGGKDVK